MQGQGYTMQLRANYQLFSPAEREHIRLKFRTKTDLQTMQLPCKARKTCRGYQYSPLNVSEPQVTIRLTEKEMRSELLGLPYLMAFLQYLILSPVLTQPIFFVAASSSEYNKGLMPSLYKLPDYIMWRNKKICVCAITEHSIRHSHFIYMYMYVETASKELILECCDKIT